MKKPEKRTVTCWGLTKSVSAIVTEPANLEDLEECLKFAKKNNLKIAVRGGGNSYSDVFQNTHHLIIDTSHLNSIKSFDTETGIVIVEAGVRIGDLLAKTLPLNWGIVGLSGSANDRIGGMISSNTHGKDSWKEGNFSQNIQSLKLLMADGTIKEISRKNDPELFYGVVSGLGFLGVIVEVTMKLKHIPSFMVESTTERIRNVSDLFEKFYNLSEENTDFSYAVLDPFTSGKFFGRGLLESSRYVDAPKCSNKKFEEFLTPKSRIGILQPKTFWSLFRLIWGYSTCNLLNKYRYFRTNSKKSIIPYPKYQYLHSSIPQLNLLYAPAGFMEFHNLFPKEKALDAFTKLLTICQRYNRQPWICGVKRHKPDTAYLSFAGDGLSITINFPLNNFPLSEREKYCNELIDTTLDYNGKTYLAKHAFLPKSTFQKMYPNFLKLLDLKSKYDPECLFLSDATKRLLLS